MNQKLLNKIYDNIELYFGNDIEKFVDDENVINIKDKFDNMCIKFYIYNIFTIEIIDVRRCSFKGSELIEKLEMLAIHNKFKEISLEDQSYISCNDLSLNFGILSILVKGMSWYNSIGYFQENYAEQKSKWDVIRKSTLRDLADTFQNVTYEQYVNANNKNWYDDGLVQMSGTVVNGKNFKELYEDFIIYIYSIFDNDVEIYIYMTELNIICKSSYNENINDIIDYFYLLSLVSYIIPYTRHPLTKIF